MQDYEMDKRNDELDAVEVPVKTNGTETKKSIEEKVANILGTKSLRKHMMEVAETREDAATKREIASRNRTHSQLPEVIDVLDTLGIAFLVGPSGTGKSTIAKQACAELFSLGETDPITSGKYAQISFSPDTTSGEMIGRSDVNGQFHESEIVRVFRDGGVILFDEIDDADPSMLIKVNTALANGYLATPVGMVQKNPKTYIVCAANTFGTGPDAMYVGRTRLDAATLDRFCLSTIYVDYDTELEKSIAAELPEDEKHWLIGYTQQVRDVIRENKMRRVCSTRFVINAARHMKRGKTPKWIRDNFLQGWSASEKKKIESSVAFDTKWFAAAEERVRDEAMRRKYREQRRPSGSRYGFF